MRTTESYIKCLQRFFKFCNSGESVGLEFSEYVRQYLLSIRNKGLSWSTLNLHYSALKLFNNKVLKRSWDIAYLPRPIQHKSLPRILSSCEITKLIHAPRSMKHRSIIVTLYATGVRISELAAIKLSDLDSQRMELFVRKGKGGKDRLVVISQDLLPLLREYFKKFRPKTYLFEGQVRGMPYSISSIQKVIYNARRQAGIGKSVSAHTLRHCYATHHLENGTDLVFLKEQLGHKSLTTTARYIHLCRYRKRQIHHPIASLSIDLNKRMK